MASVRQRELPKDPDAAAIVKVLAENVYVRRQDDVFEDFLSLALATLDRLPYHLQSVAAFGQHADDGEHAAEFQRIAGCYKRAEMEHFSHALAMLLQAAKREPYRDLLGDIYMAWGWPNTGAGQFFTPMSICKLMAAMTMPDIEAECRKRVAQAIDAGPFARMGLARGESIIQPGKEQVMLHALLEHVEYLEPITVYDCACGSGAMLLAAASICPQWALDYAIVRFYGQDIDLTCTKMARIQLMLYGLNGYRMRCHIAAHGALDDSARTLKKAPLTFVEPPMPSGEPTIVLPNPREVQLEMFA